MLFTLESFWPVTDRQTPYTIQHALTVASIIKSRVSVQNKASYGLPWQCSSGTSLSDVGWVGMWV